MVKNKGKGRAEPAPTPMETGPHNITLFCWILDESGSPFPVDIQHSMTVGHLKDAIFKKKSDTFANVDADQLTLEGQWLSSTFTKLSSQIFHVSIAINSDLKNKVTKHQFLDEDVLPVARPLWKIFPHPESAEETLHIVVKAGEYVNRSANSKLNYSS